MRKTQYGLALGAAALSLCLSMGSANAVPTTSITLQEAGFADVTVGGVGASANFSGTFGTFTFNSIDGHGNPDVSLPVLLSSNSVNTSSSTAGTVVITVTTAGITDPLGIAAFTSGFTSNLLTAGWTVLEETFLVRADLTTVALGSMNFTAIGTNSQVTGAATGPGPYSVIERYTVTSVGVGSANSTQQLTAAVPGPLAGAGLPGLVAACMGLVAFARRRRAKFA